MFVVEYEIATVKSVYKFAHNYVTFTATSSYLLIAFLYNGITTLKRINGTSILNDFELEFEQYSLT